MTVTSPSSWPRQRGSRSSRVSVRRIPVASPALRRPGGQPRARLAGDSGRDPARSRLLHVCCLKYRRVVARDGTIRAGRDDPPAPGSVGLAELWRSPGRTPAPARRADGRLGRRADRPRPGRARRPGPATGPPACPVRTWLDRAERRLARRPRAHSPLASTRPWRHAQERAGSGEADMSPIT